MSLINQMLKDLERRKGGGGTEPLSAGIRVVAGGGRSRLGWGLALALVGGLAGAGAWWYGHRAPAPESLPAAKRWPESGQPQAAEIGLPPQPAVAAPLVPPPPASGPPHSVTEPLAATAPAAAAEPPEPPSKVAKAAAEAPTPAKPAHKPKRRHPRRPADALPQPAPAESGYGAEEFYRQGLRSYRRGLYPQAQRQLERSLELAPGHGAARALLAKSYLASGQYQRAERVLGEGEAEQDQDAARLKAQIYLKQGRAELAEKALEAGSGGGDPADLGVRAALKQQQGRYPEAEQLYRRALRVQPGESRWWLGLAISLEASQRYQEAIDAYRRALETGTSGAARRYAESRIGALRAAR
jgi:MSHA biogenesis protein MshN